MPITKEQVSDMRSVVNELIEAELDFKRAQLRLMKARNSIDYQFINLQKKQEVVQTLGPGDVIL